MTSKKKIYLGYALFLQILFKSQIPPVCPFALFFFFFVTWSFLGMFGVQVMHILNTLGI
jgi:hypothetical protein